MKFVRFILNYASLHFILIFLYQTLRWWYFNVSTSLACAVHHELTLLRARVFWVSTSFRPHLGDQKLLINGRNFLEFSRSWLADRQMSVTIVSSLVIRMCDPVCYARSTRCVRVWGGLRLVYFCTKRMSYLLINFMTMCWRSWRECTIHLRGFRYTGVLSYLLQQIRRKVSMCYEMICTHSSV